MKSIDKSDVCKRRRWIVPCLLCFLVFGLVVLLLVLVVSERREAEPSIQLMVDDKGTCIMEIRIENLEVKGDETFVNANIYVKIWDTSKLDDVYLEVKDPRHLVGRYKLRGHYYSSIRVYEGERDLPLYPKKGSLLFYPFENLSFDFSIELDPKRNFREIHVYDRLTGFFTDNLKYEGKKITILLKSKPYGRAFFIVLVLLLFIYLIVVIVKVRKIELLVTSLVTFFISIWSIRSVVNDFIIGSVTLFDLVLLIFSVLLLSSILVMIFFRYYTTEE